MKILYTRKNKCSRIYLLAVVLFAIGNTKSFAACTLPTTQAAMAAFGIINSSGTVVNWTRGNGADVIVVARLTSTAPIDPVASTTYTASTAFGNTTTSAYYTGTGNYIVYIGTGTTVTVTGLAAGSSYTFTVYEFNVTGGPCYLTPGVSSAASYTAATSVCPGGSTSALSTPTFYPATGGTINTSITPYYIHSFTSTSGGTFTALSNVTAEVLVVAGGGGGSGETGGGGGAGGFIDNTSYAIAGENYAITVGAGGNGGTTGSSGLKGNNSAFGSVAALTATGGGLGANNSNPGGSGGSGGGDGAGDAGVTNTGTAGQGHNGGTGVSGGSFPAGGGGGASAVGANGSGTTGGAGGAGTASSASGASVTYAGGGGGGIYSSGTGGSGGPGGGGNAGSIASPNGIPGTANTGGGGGAGSNNAGTGGMGGSGIVIIKYQAPTGTWSSANTSIATVNSSTGVVSGVAAGSTTINYTITTGGSTTVQATPVTVNADPTTQSSAGSTANITFTAAVLSWTRGNGSDVLVEVYPTSGSAVAPAAGTSYTANTNYTSGGSTGTGNYTVYNGTGDSVSISGLNVNTSYTCALYEYNNSGCYMTPAYTFTFATGSPCTPPGTQATIGSYTSTTSTGTTVNWTRGSGDNVIVLARLTSTTAVDPVIGTPYSASPVFGSVNTTGAGNYVVYIGAGTSVPVTNLSPTTGGTGYAFTVYEFYNSGDCYSTPGSSSGMTTSSCTPTSQAAMGSFTGTTASTAIVNWTRGNGSNVIVVGRLTSTTDVDPSSYSSYTANTAFGSGSPTGAGSNNFVVYIGTGDSVTVSGLSSSTAYTFTAYEYNSTGICYMTPGSAAAVTTYCSYTVNSSTSVCTGGTTTLTPPAFTAATGGDNVISSGGYNIHEFKTTGQTFTCNSVTSAEVFVVGGGGGGGDDIGGGGGGGGVVDQNPYTLSSSSYLVTLGGGGNGAPSGTDAVSSDGGNSTFGTAITAYGGGGGGSGWNTAAYPAQSGASGGGAPSYTSSGASGTQGNSGGNNGPSHSAGGGGGAGTAGTTPTSITNPGNGGNGVSNSILGTTYYWGAGGGGAGHDGSNGGNGGKGGGGGGADYYTAASPTSPGTGDATYGLNTGSNGGGGNATAGGAAGANTGSGGGGGAYSQGAGGKGGSGIVVVKYPVPTSISWSSSNTAVATVNGSGVVTGVTAGTATINYTYSLGSCVYNLATPITVSADPTTQASAGSAINISYTTGILNWTRGNGSDVLVEVYPTSGSAVSPAAGSSYTANTNYGSGGSTGTGNYTVYNGTGDSVSISGLTANTGYTVALYEYNSTGCYMTPGYSFTFTTSATCTPPTTQAAIGSFTSTTSSGTTVNWTRGNGDNVIVVAHLTSTTAVDPVIGTSYSASPVFGSVNTTGAGNYVVYIGTGTSVSVTGLAASTGGTGYTFAVYEYFNATYCYKAPGSSAGMTTSSCIPTVQATMGAFANTTPSGTIVNWTRGNGDNVIVVGRLTSTTDADPTSYSSYTANTAFGSGSATGTGNYVVYMGTGDSVTVSGLAASTGYTFTAYEYNSTGICYMIPGSPGAVSTVCSYTLNSSTTLCVGNTTTLTAPTFTAATGGTITTSGGYNIHTFNGSGTFNSNSVTSAEILVVGGGGGGASGTGGGGGAGGLIYNSSFGISANTSYPITVGSGGAGGATQYASGSPGTNSVFSTNTALGGGYGGGNSYAGGSGGSGGGSGWTQPTTPGGAATQSPGYGNAGGGGSPSALNGYGAGGGGGAGTAGTAGASIGTGGAGLQYSQFASYGGSPAGWFAGGGGGGSDGGTAGTGGQGGGGAGTSSTTGISGTANTGGGGGGTSLNSGGAGGAGGAGIVIIKYPLVTGASWSSSNTAVATVNSSGLVTAVGAGTATINYTYTVGTCVTVQATPVTVGTSLPPAPSVGVVNAGCTSTLTASGYTGSLLWNTGATTASITVATNGTYSVTQTVAGCTGPAGTGSPTLNTPTTQAAMGTFTSTTAAGTTVNWTRGNGGGVVVVARLTSTADADPTSGNTYAANTVFSSGNTTGTGNYVVYNGTGTSVTVTGLAASTSYTFTAYEYSSSGTCYLTPGAALAVTTYCNYVQNSAAAVCLSGTTTLTAPAFPAATGGNSIDSTSVPGYRIHTFTSSSGTFNSNSVTNVEVLMVGGGGGGASGTGGGGGAGGLIHNTAFTISANTAYPVSVGGGGAGETSGISGTATSGSSTTFNTLTANGGGAGGSNITQGLSGGSGGGSGWDVANGGSSTQSAGFGNAGGGNAGSANDYGAGGGGGAGSAGTAGSNTVTGGTGGAGLQFTQFASYGGSPAGWFAGGGGGGTDGSGVAGAGGSGGGGAGSITAAGSAGTTSTGGGGGGSGANSGPGGNGGSGIVIIKYQTPTGIFWSSSNTAVATVNSSGVVSGVAAGTAIINYNYTIGTCTYVQATPITVAADPSTQASGGSASSVILSGATLNWTRGNGNNVLVAVRATSGSTTDPSAGSTYTANTTFGSGNTTGTGDYVVYNGTGTSVAITGLSPSTNYTVTLYEYNSTGCYMLPAYSFTFTSASPSVALSDNSPQVTAASVYPCTANLVLLQTALAVTNASATLTGMNIITMGSYAAADITDLKVWYSASNTFSTGTSTQLSTITSPGIAGTQTFTPFTSQIIAAGTTGYIYVTADIAGSAVVGDNIRVSSLGASNFTFSSGSVTGNTSTGGLQGIITEPAISGVTGATVCNAGTVTLGATASAGGTVTWYAAATGGTVLATGNSYSPTVAGTTTFYVSPVTVAQSAGCFSLTPVTATVYESPGTGNISANAAPFNSSGGTNITVGGSTGNDVTVTGNVTMTSGTYNFNNFTVNTGATVTVTGSAPLVINCWGTATVTGIMNLAGANGSTGISSCSGINETGGTGGTGGGGGGIAGGNGGAVQYPSPASAGSAGGSYCTLSGGGHGGAASTCGAGNCYDGGGGGGGYGTAGSNASIGTASGGAVYGDAYLATVCGSTSTNLMGGSGGGGGGGGISGSGYPADPIATGGGGGGGGGAININANTINLTGGTISVAGGNGGNGQVAGGCVAQTATNISGGGGGGSGGTVLLESSVCTACTVGSNVDISGGTGGTSNGSNSGGTGGNGRLVTQTFLPNIVLGTSPSVCSGVTTANLPYVATINSPTQYSITFNSAAISAGFSNVALTTLPASPIGISVPSNVAAGIYNATISVSNPANPCGAGPAVAFTITVNNTAAPAGLTNETVCTNTSSGNVTFSVTNPGAGLTVDWSTNGTADNDGTGTSKTKTVTVGTPITEYVQIYNSTTTCYSTWASATGNAYANPTATITGTLTGCVNPGIVLNGTTSTAGTGETISSYQWSNSVPTVVGTNSTYTATATGSYKLLVTNNNGCTATSAASSVTANANPTATITGTLTGCVSPGVTLNGSTSTAGAGETISTYQWSNSVPTVVGTSSTYTATATSSYTLLVTNNNGCTATSSPGSLTASVNPTAVISGTLSGCVSPGVTLGTTGSIAGSGTISGYQWANSGGNINGATNGTYTATASDNYSVIVTNSNGCSATSSASSVTANINPTAVISGTLSGCASPGVILGTTGSGAGSGTITNYQWANSGGNINGATNSTYTATATDNYSVIITNSNNCSATSTTSAVTANANPLAPTSGGNVTICASSAPGTVSASSAGNVIDWYDAASNGNLLQSSSNTYTTSASGTYYAESRNATTGCVSTSLTPVTLTVNPLPTQYDVTGGLCVPADLGLSNSDNGINYYLQLNGVNTGQMLPGNGTPLDFGLENTVGVYNIKAVNASTTCTDTMLGIYDVAICTATWAGGTSTNWSDPTNWNPQAVPNVCGVTVIINSGLSNYPVISGTDVTVGTVDISAGASITLDRQTLSVCQNWNGGTGANASVDGTGTVILSGTAAQTISGNTEFDILQIANVEGGVSLVANTTVSIADGLQLAHGNLNVSAGTLTLLSASSSNNSYIDDFSFGSNPGTITGNIIAQRYVPVKGSNQHYISSPVSTPAFSQLNASGPDGSYIIPTGTCDENSSAYISPYGTVFQYNDGHQPSGACMLGNWEIRSAGNTVNGQGYSAYLTGNSTLSLTSTANTGNVNVATYNSAYPAVPTLQQTADGGNGAIESGWALVGNPYPSALDLTDLADRIAAGYDAQVQVWKTSGPFSGTWQATTITGESGVVVIPPFQAFMVHVTTGKEQGNYTYPFYQSERTRTTDLPFYRSQNQNTLQLTVDFNGVQDMTTVSFNPSATNGFDAEYDANKQDGSAGNPTLYTFFPNATTWYSINTVPSLTQTAAIPVGLRPNNTGTMTITPQGIESFDPTTYIYLEDKQTGVWTNLRNGSYSFTTTPTDNQQRFILHFTPPAIILTEDASCDAPGMINIQQPGTANWNYTVTDVNNATVASGMLNAGAPVTVSVNTGVYTLTLTDNTGYTVIKTIQVQGSQPIVAAFNASETTAQVTSNIQFTSTTANASTYSWDFGDGVTATGSQASHSYQSVGIYIVKLTVTGSGGCISTTSQAITVTTRAVTGVTNLSENDISIWSYENTVFVDFSKQTNVDAQVEIYNVLGQLLSSERFGKSSLYSKEIDNLQAAYMIVRVKNEDNIITKKVLITNK